MSLSTVLSGTVIVEVVFNIRGVGRLFLDAIFAHDFPVVQGSILFIAIVVLFMNLLVDISWGWFDPRIRYG